jgi:GNAT superfamily N-acetyltransferase
MIHYKSEHDSVDWVYLARLLEEANLGKRDPTVVERAFRGSAAVCYAYDGCHLIGAGRGISDGVACSAIYDVVVAPHRRGQGVGRSVMLALLQQLPIRSVMLLSTPNQCGFYARLGFKTLKTAMMKHEDREFWIRNGYMSE